MELIDFFKEVTQKVADGKLEDLTSMNPPKPEFLNWVEDIFSFSEERLAKYKVPRIIEFPISLPKTISGKIRRIELRANEATSKLKKETRTHEYFHAKY